MNKLICENLTQTEHKEIIIFRNLNANLFLT